MSTAPAADLLDLKFAVNARHHGKGSLLYSWCPTGHFVASSGSSRVVHVFDTAGVLVDQVVTPSPSLVTALQWNSAGDVLAIMQAASPTVVLWNRERRETKELDTGGFTRNSQVILTPTTTNPIPASSEKLNVSPQDTQAPVRVMCMGPRTT